MHTSVLYKLWATVTGGNSGIGTETARVLASRGCTVIITSRRKEAAEKAIQQIKEKNGKPADGEPSYGDVSYVLLDLADLDSVKAASKDVLAKTKVIDFLVLNAGVMHTPYQKTKNNLEMQIGERVIGSRRL